MLYSEIHGLLQLTMQKGQKQKREKEKSVAMIVVLNTYKRPSPPLPPL